MTATEELRRLLDERGVKWWPMHDVENGYRDDRDTEFLAYGCKHVAHEWGCRLQVDMLTPAQAVEATLGRGKCKMETVDGCPNWNSCSVCDSDYYSDQPLNYCPNCGREVER